MSLLLSLDPGRQGLGWAAFRDGKLVAAGVVKQPKGPRDYEQASLQEVADNARTEILRTVQGLTMLLPSPFRSCVVERMTSYPGKGQYAANDLLDLQAIGGMVAGALCPLAGISWLRPQEWKGSVDTEILAGKLGTWLSPEELAICAVAEKKHKKRWHNAVDAIHLAGKHLRRWSVQSGRVSISNGQR